MKYADLIETVDWDEMPYANRQDEIDFLKQRRSALQHFIMHAHLRMQETAKKCHKASTDAFLDPEYLRQKKKYDRLEHVFVSLMQRIKDLTVKNNTFVFTGFRDARLEKRIKDLGGRVVTSMSGKVDYLVTEDPYSTSGKAKRAKDQGTRIISKAYLLQLLRD